jgi:acyl carrier protein
MNRDEILKGVFEVLSRYEGRGTNHSALTESTSLVDQLNINSARMVDIVIDLEEKFGITIDDTKLPQLETVSDVVSLVEGILNAQKTTT